MVVRDGPVAPALAATLDELADTSPVPVDVVALHANIGLGPALDAGLAACTHDVVARMDADDLSLPHRFAVQMPIIEAGADLVGAGLVEFGARAEDLVGRRTPPTDPETSATAPGSPTPSTTPPSSTAAAACRPSGGTAGSR